MQFYSNIWCNVVVVMTLEWWWCCNSIKMFLAYCPKWVANSCKTPTQIPNNCSTEQQQCHVCALLNKWWAQEQALILFFLFLFSHRLSTLPLSVQGTMPVEMLSRSSSLSYFTGKGSFLFLYIVYLIITTWAFCRFTMLLQKKVRLTSLVPFSF